MRQRIFKSVSLLVTLGILVAFVLIEVVNYQQFYEITKANVRTETGYVAEALNGMGQEYLTREVGNMDSSRLTLIDVDGTVLYDSNQDIAQMENHRERPEIQAAMENGTGEVTRYSSTLGETTYYYALRLENGQVIRLAYTTDSVFSTMMSAITLLALIIVGVILLVLFAVGKYTKRLVEPINQLDLEHPLENDIYEELSPLMRRLNQQNQVISKQVEELKTNHQEYLAITDNMKDGLIVTNQKVVLSINHAAKAIYQLKDETCVGQNILLVSRQEALKEAWETAISGQSCEKMVERDGRSYEMLANPVVIDGQVQGAVILILDVTEKIQSENMRKEFSANVSHELKTPLMSISGYAELIQNNMVKAEDIPEFAGRIYREANRLSALVADIIRLSRLDELGQSAMEVEEVDLYQVSQEVYSSLEMQAQKRNIELILTGEHATIHGVRQIMYEVLFNLCDNAVKYNKDGGTVAVQIHRDAAGIQWTVSDTGIGISPADQERIFERFYRVDKSHSRETGGTGLGLSIVKHGAAIHQAKIQVESKEGEGTTISLRFPG